MRNLWLLFVVAAVATGLTHKVLATPTSSSHLLDDLYLESGTSGDLPVDDEDGDDDGSGSGSGDGDQVEEILRMLDGDSPSQENQTGSSHRIPSTTPAPSPQPTAAKDLKIPDTVTDVAGKAEETEVSSAPTSTATAPPRVEETEEDNSLDERIVPATTTMAGHVSLGSDSENEIVPVDTRGRMHNLGKAVGDVTSENMWERTEVLAAVIACGVVGFLCAILLMTLLAYRMKKKDEGSYDLGDTKLTNAQYQKAPTKEFYA